MSGIMYEIKRLRDTGTCLAGSRETQMTSSGETLVVNKATSGSSKLHQRKKT